MPSEFETALLPELRRMVPDLQAEYPIEGHGKKWLANLFSEKENLLIEACSRNVVRTGKSKSSIQHYEKFYSMLLKLIDIKSRHPKMKPVMIWKGFIPAHSTDLKLCTVWGVYVMSYQEPALPNIMAGDSADSVNRRALGHLIRRSDAYKPRWRWLAEGRKASLVELLKLRAMGTREIAKELGLDYLASKSDISGMLRDLCQGGKAVRLTRGYVRGYGAVYGVNVKQLDKFEAEHFGEYKSDKRKERIAGRIIQVLKEEGPMNYKQVQARLQHRWGIDATRETVVGILSNRLRRQSLVRAKGLPKHLVYSAV